MTNYLDLAEIVLRIIEKSTAKTKTRRSFSKSVKDSTLKIQNFCCNDCGKKSKVWDFDHIDGDSLNNSLSNCQALCPNCHAKKTRKLKQKSLKLSKIIRSLKAFFQRLGLNKTIILDRSFSH